MSPLTESAENNSMTTARGNDLTDDRFCSRHPKVA